MRRGLIHSIGLGVTILGLAAVADAAVPGQFIAKLYTEAFGRAPDPGGWQSSVNYYTQAGCSQSTLASHGKAHYLSAEFASLGYDNVEKVLTAYRGILNRDPDAGGFNVYLNYLNQGNPFSSMLDSLFASAEFAGFVPGICSGGSYGWGAAPALALPTAGGGFQGGTGAQLQAVLDATPAGSTVFLAPRAVVTADQTIYVPAGVTLATTGFPDRAHYARMGRIVRTALFPVQLLELKPGAKLQSVWVSGQRPIVGYSHDAANIFVRSGTGGVVQNSRTDTPAGFSTLFVHGIREQGIACVNVTVSGNLSTGYSSGHTDGTWADGIDTSCENTTITDNHIVDPTDVGMVLFRADPAAQQSQITNNTIVSAGLSAYGALGVDPLCDPQVGGVSLCGPQSGVLSPSFAGSLISGNQFWSSPTTHFDIGLAVGTMAWFASVGGVNGTGATVRNNTTASITTTVNTGILVDGMLSATVAQNSLALSLASLLPCPSGAMVADWPSHASGSLPPWSQAAAHACVFHAAAYNMYYCHIPDYSVLQTSSQYSDTGTCAANLAYYKPGQTTGICYLSLGTAQTECFPPQSMYYCHVPDYGVRQTSSASYTSTSTCQGNLAYYLPGQTTGLCYRNFATAQAACAP